ncbi:MAG: hypothetical protein EXS16_20770 [Gemmataceae bacterium]|nr:hypothetical protein [Gemmataceae bacterium]
MECRYNSRMADTHPLPTDYHRAIVAQLQTDEPELVRWFASSRQRTAQADAIRLDLLKSTYRLEREAQPKMYAIVDALRDQLQLTATVTLYQAQTGTRLNASLAYLPGEAHVILAGPMAEKLAENELRAVLAHELGHFVFFTIDEGIYLVISELLDSLSRDAASGPTFTETARLYRLWTEIYADRWACRASGDPLAAIAALIKTETGVSDVNAESYLRQADEILAKPDEHANQTTHPESYIRARALKLWAERGTDASADIERMIQGPMRLDQFDLLSQKRTARRTRELLELLLAPAWYRTDTVTTHAKRFVADFMPNGTIAPATIDELKRDADQAHASWRDYLCFVMLDFVTVDRDLGDVALASAIVLSRKLGLDERFIELAQKELGMTKKAFAKVEKDADGILVKAT